MIIADTFNGGGFTITVFDTDGVTRKTGLAGSAFTKVLTKDGSYLASPTVTVSEIDAVNAPGQYWVGLTAWTGLATGLYHFDVLHPTYGPSGWTEDIYVSPAAISMLSTVLTDVVTLIGRLTNARAGYLDLLNSFLDSKVSFCMQGGATVDVGSFSGGAPNQLKDAVGDAAKDTTRIDIDGKTLQEAVRIISAVMGKSSGEPNPTYFGLDGTTPRVQFTVDGSNNRTGAVYP